MPGSSAQLKDLPVPAAPADGLVEADGDTVQSLSRSGRYPMPGTGPPLSDRGLLDECDVWTFKGSGPGGQSVNTTDSAVRLRHRPTGIVVTCRSQRSQHQNKTECLRRLRERIEALGRHAPERVPTRISKAAQQRRLEEKARRAATKRERARPEPDE
jgi:hypothetical protein